jgi:hypothetical protein
MMTDSTKSWTTNQWVNYSVEDTVTHGTGYITSNTSNTLTYTLYTDSGGPNKWNTGDGYKIHKLLIALDQPGRGQGDLISGNVPLNITTGTVAWTHQALEPCYSWNNLCNGAQVDMQGGIGPPTIQANRDYFNRTRMPGYVPYTYPHPLVSGSPSSPTNLRILSGP